jgi:hypothetical protein
MCLAHELGIAGFNPRKIATTATISMQATEESQEASKLGEQQHTAPKSNGQPESVRKAPERAGPRLNSPPDLFLFARGLPGCDRRILGFRRGIGRVLFLARFFGYGLW